MKTYRITTILLALICLGLFATAHLSAQNAEPASALKTGGLWEHMAMTHQVGPNVTDATLARKIAQANRDGWELVDVESVDRDGTTVKMVYFFKRPQ